MVYIMPTIITVFQMTLSHMKLAVQQFHHFQPLFLGMHNLKLSTIKRAESMGHRRHFRFKGLSFSLHLSPAFLLFPLFSSRHFQNKHSIFERGRGREQGKREHARRPQHGRWIHTELSLSRCCALIRPLSHTTTFSCPDTQSPRQTGPDSQLQHTLMPTHIQHETMAIWLSLSFTHDNLWNERAFMWCVT